MLKFAGIFIYIKSSYVHSCVIPSCVIIITDTGPVELKTELSSGSSGGINGSNSSSSSCKVVVVMCHCVIVCHVYTLQCFDDVGSVTGRASSL